MPVYKGSTRKHKPTALKILAGSFNSTREKGVPKVRSSASPKAPAYLSKSEKDAWDKFVSTLGPKGMRIITEDDWAVVEQLACVYDEMRRVRASLRARRSMTFTERKLMKNGAVIETEKPVPEIFMLKQMDLKLTGLLGRVGLTPADRGRVQDLDAHNEGQENPDDEFSATSIG